jgi:hypothetical protein
MRQASSNKCNEKLFVGTKKKISYILGSRKGGDHAIIANTIPIGFSHYSSYFLVQYEI